MGFIDPGEVIAILDDHFKEKIDNSYKIWSLLTLSLWWRMFQ